MHHTKLRKVGGSVMLAIPPAVLETLDLAADRAVGLEVIDGGIVVRPARPKYTLAELLADCEQDAPAIEDERAWLDDAPAGREQI